MALSIQILPQPNLTSSREAMGLGGALIKDCLFIFAIKCAMEKIQKEKHTILEVTVAAKPKKAKPKKSSLEAINLAVHEAKKNKLDLTYLRP
jgi:hypothetical protein